MSIKDWLNMVLIAFFIGFLIHIGTNTAKIVWPSPPVEFKVSVSE